MNATYKYNIYVRFLSKEAIFHNIYNSTHCLLKLCYLWVCVRPLRRKLCSTTYYIFSNASDRSSDWYNTIFLQFRSNVILSKQRVWLQTLDQRWSFRVSWQLLMLFTSSNYREYIQNFQICEMKSREKYAPKKTIT